MNVLDVAAGALDAHPAALLSIFAEELQLLVVRGAFDPAPLAAAARRLESDTPLPPHAVEYPAKPEVPQVRVLGQSLYSADASLERYFDGAGALRARFEELFAADMELAITSLLARLAGGRAIAPLQSRDGRAYAPARIPLLADGIGIPPHTDNEFFTRPGFREVKDLVVPTLVSFVVPLQLPPGGGVLEVFEPGAGAAGPKKRGGGPVLDEDLADAPRTRVAASVGDVIVFDSGRRLHRVTAAAGGARLTLSGSLALGADGQSVYYCG